jgi:hypothetical protein
LGDVVIVAYRPKPGCDQKLLDLAADHVPLLRRLGLATDRPATMMQGQDGVVIEVFEWADGAIAAAHQNPQILELWGSYAAICDYVPLSALPEAAELFATFKPVE